jgi:hypothetical protein
LESMWKGTKVSFENGRFLSMLEFLADIYERPVRMVVER